MDDRKRDGSRASTANESSDDKEVGYSVGYKRPPREHQFKRGHNGFPRRRTKDSFVDRLQRKLFSRLVVTEGGRKKTALVIDVLIETLVRKALSGDTRARRDLLNLLDRHPKLLKERFVPKITSEMSVKEAAAIYERMLHEGFDEDS
jgi:hypothetical protein